MLQEPISLIWERLIKPSPMGTNLIGVVIKIKIMESYTGVRRWLRMLLLSAGMTARSRMQSRFRWFRRSDKTDPYSKNTKLKNIQRNKEIQPTMKIRLQILRWLSLLQFPALPGSRASKLSHFALFRRTYSSTAFKIIFLKTLKYK
jgi:hypothetical protein